MDFRKERKKKNFDGVSESVTIWENDKIIPPNIRKRAMMAREIAKNLLPSLHNKTHF